MARTQQTAGPVIHKAVETPTPADSDSGAKPETSAVNDKTEQAAVIDGKVATDEVAAGEDTATSAEATTSEEAKTTSTEDTPKKIIGMSCETKELYQKEDEQGRTSWTIEYPNNLEEAAENDDTAHFAILVRKKKSFDPRKKLEIDSIVIQSPLLKDALFPVLENYPGVTTTIRRLIFEAPFKPFVHRWTEFTEAVDAEANEETKTHLQLLHATLASELKDALESREDYIKNKVISFEHLWTIFEPGCTIYSTAWDRDIGSRFAHGDYVKHPKFGPCYAINCQVLDWDGERFGYITSQELVIEYNGTRKIADLVAFPLQYHPEEQKIRNKLLARGRLFENYRGYHYMAYKSFAIGQNKCGNDIKVTVDSRIIVDATSFGKNNPNGLPYMTSLYDTGAAEPNSDDDSVFSFDDNDDANIPSHRELEILPLTDTELIHTSPRVRGYALKLRRWLEFFVDEINPIAWNTSAFSSLVLPNEQKDLILAFTSSHMKNQDSFDDVISGKGKGIIMLLSGGPGIGKTLTAESVAENMKVPLYMMSAGDLGTSSWEVEDGLSNIFELVSKWNAVLLLDECDVFLEARAPNDLARNQIVSIFLRTLEYYEGILFMTTNRISDMDPAFQSRIHITMEYPELDSSARKQVWMNFLSMSKDGHKLSAAEIDKLAAININGRQIKNVLKTSQLLAKHKDEPLGFAHVKTVLDTEKKGLGLK